MIASLPMYWRPETANLWAGFWDVLSNHIELPKLTPPSELPENLSEHWTDPALVLSQTCSLPLRTTLRGRVRYVGTFDFGLGEPSGSYHSVLISRPDADLRRGPLRLAYNGPDSQSGWAAALDPGANAPSLRYTKYLLTGSHAASMRAVASGLADVAWLDAMTWRILEAYDPAAAGVVVRAQSRPTPGLPLITSLKQDPTPIRQAVAQATIDYARFWKQQFGGPFGFRVWGEAAYLDQPVPDPPPLP